MKAINITCLVIKGCSIMHERIARLFRTDSLLIPVILYVFAVSNLFVEISVLCIRFIRKPPANFYSKTCINDPE